MAKFHDPGRMDQKIVIRAPAEARSPSGAGQLEYADYATVWAHIEYGGGGEKEEMDKITFFKNVTMTFRELSGLGPEMIVSYDGKIYDIYDISSIGRVRYHIIKCVERE